MAGVQPTQVLPSWLSFSSFTTVDASGVPTTEATIVMLPLTYFGPSIPLGTDTRIWVYGGSTSPASTSTVPTTSQPTTTLITSSTASSPSPLPSSSSPVPTPTPTPTSSTTSNSSSSNSQTSLSQTSSSLTSSQNPTSTPIASASSQSQSSSSLQSNSSLASSSSTLASPSPSTGALGNNSHPLSARAIVGIVIAGAFILVLLGFLLFLLCRRRRRRPQQLPPAGGHSTSSWSAFEVVDAEAGAAHDPGAVGMGEHEHDPLVSGHPAMTETAPPYAAPPRLVSRRPAPDASLLAHTDDPSGVALQESLLATTLLPPHDFGDSYDDIIASSAFVVGDEPMSPGSERSSRHEDSPLLPPRTLNPDMLPTGSRNSNYSSLLNNYDRSAIPSIAYPDSPVSDVDEGAALMTARRVRVDSEDHADPPSASGLTGFARLSRLSWLNRPLLARPHSSVSSRHSGSLGASARQMSERQESNRNSLNVSQPRPHSMSQRSGSSGLSVYYDAASIVSNAPSDPLKHFAVDPDPLDMPVPPSAAASLSSIGSQARYPAFPPGLVSPDQALLPTQLEDEPPLPGGRWKSMHGDVGAGGSIGKAAGRRGPQAFDSNTPLDLDITESLRLSSGIIPPTNKVVSNEFASISDLSQTSHDEPSSRDVSTDLDSTPHQSESSLRLVSDRNALRYSGFALPPLLPLYNPNGTSVSSRGSRAESSTTVAATMKDPETGAMMHFPSTIWHPGQSASEWPDDAWTEFPDGRGAKWYGPPLHLKRYREQTGDPGSL